MKVFISNFPDTSAMPQLALVLTRIQLCYIPDSTFLMVEDRDWLVVMQCLQDHNRFKINHQRPPLKAFVRWLNQQHVPQLLAHCSAERMSEACRQLNSERYPWNNVHWESNLLRRWRILYRQLSHLLEQMEDDSKQSTQNFV